MHYRNNIRKISLCFIFLFFFLCNYSGNSFSAAQGSSTFEKAKEHFKKGFIFYNRMQYLSAVEFFRKAVSEYPEYYTAREYLARSYKLAGFINEAIKEWELLGNMTSNNISIMNKLEALRYRISSEVQDKVSIGSLDLVFSDEYNSIDMGRYRFPKPIDMAIDSEKNIYITSFNSAKLIKLSPNGEGLSIFDKGAGTRFYGVACRKDTICVSDYKADSIYVLDKHLNLIKSFGGSGNEIGKFHGPKGLVIDNHANLYVIDSGNHRVQKFDKNWNFILKFGEPGEYEAQLNNPSNIYIDNNIIYVTDTGNKRIACFDDSGNFIKNILIKGLDIPRGISFYDKKLIVADEKKGLIFYSLDNNTSILFNSWNNSKKSFSKVITAHCDRDERLYCLDYNRENVVVFSKLENVYTNLDIEITSLDTSKYPVVAFYLNIRSRNGRPVYNLGRKNFKITEDDTVAANISVDYLKNEKPSISTVLCIDRSNGNSGYHNEIPWVSDFLLKKMKRNDSVQLLNFNKDTWIGNDFDWSRRRTVKALRKRDYSEGKAIDKALYNAVSNLIQKMNRRGVVLISNGIVEKNSFAKYTPENIIEFAKSHYISINIIVFKEKDPVLRRICEETGGNIYKANELDGLRSIYNKIKESEEYRYVVIYPTYKTPSIKGWWSDIKIEIDYKGHRGVEWGGYFVP